MGLTWGELGASARDELMCVTSIMRNSLAGTLPALNWSNDRDRLLS